MPPVRIVVLSDTHSLHAGVQVPPGDVLIHAGDLTNHGALEDVVAFDRFLAALPHRHKLVIAGNHDFCFERQGEAARAALRHATYLEDEAIAVEGIRFYGSPWQPWFYDWAFNLRRGPEIRARWELIPEDTDVLITHGPPLGHGDLVRRGERVGCQDLLERVRQIKPRYHLFGHIHEAYGTTSDGTTTYVNASICDLAYRPVHSPVVLSYPD
ncbi:MAG: metallophosphoesterase [bacterium]|nr:metallophosphoesterase [bacterium]